MDKIEKLIFFLVIQKLYRFYPQSFNNNHKENLITFVFVLFADAKGDDIADALSMAAMGKVNFYADQ
ncbi:hypothetical protein [Nitrosomonas sp. Nm33]|uniref:hypothetical protein n=1 Tax=Nitrosomonas sp. Nm33 TaxID=133724 RepID=UPI00089CA389|nr:hypothetical protein [Nitrosomonas sp. Nm33]SDZ07924.1 hypothetical protein SAMN05421755_11037 [Nitrosomonas sp. Nm33]